MFCIQSNANCLFLLKFIGRTSTLIFFSINMLVDPLLEYLS